MRGKIAALQEALTGFFTDHHAFLLAKMLARVAAINADIAALDERIGQMIAPFIAAARRLADIPGIRAIAACAILAEIGTTVDRFPPPGTWSPGPSLPLASRSPPARRKARTPDTATATWPGCSATPPPRPGGPTPSWASATGASPAAGQQESLRRRRPVHARHHLAPARRP